MRWNFELRKAFSDSIPVMAGYGTMGFAAGVLLSVHGAIPMPAFWELFPVPHSFPVRFNIFL
jgi:predicted branched-subunit amino acid permease